MLEKPPPTVRARICELHSIGWSYKKIHDRFPFISYSTVRYTIKKETSRSDQRSQYRSGQPKKLSLEQERDLIQKAQEDEHIEMRGLHEAVQQHTSKSTVRGLFRNIHKRKWRQRQRPEIQPIHAEKRLNWARRYEYLSPEDWRRVIWTDECSVERGKGIRPIWTWNSPTEQLEKQDIYGVRTGKSVKQMFWAGFSYDRRTGLVPLDGDPDSRHHGVTSSIISDLYRSYLPILFTLEISLCMIMLRFIQQLLYRQY